MSKLGFGGCPSFLLSDEREALIAVVAVGQRRAAGRGQLVAIAGGKRYQKSGSHFLENKLRINPCYDNLAKIIFRCLVLRVYI